MIKSRKVADNEQKMTSKKLSIFCLLLIICCLFLSCSQPILEPEQCIASRNVVKKFYSFHIGNEMKPSEDYLKRREKFLSEELIKNIEKQLDSSTDYFTQTDDYPKAFRAGACENAGKDKAKFEILLFWRKNETNIQRPIEVEAIKENDKWLVNKVTSKE